MITGFQFRAALAVTNTEVNHLAKCLKKHPLTLLRHKKTPNLNYLQCHSKTLHLITEYFLKQKIDFSIKDTVIMHDNDHDAKDFNDINRFQLVCGRIATGLTQKELATMINSSSSTISALERFPNKQLVYTRKIKNKNLKFFFERLGVKFSSKFSVTLDKDPAQIIKNVS